MAIVAAHAGRVRDLSLSDVAQDLSATRGRLDAFDLDSDPVVNTRDVFSWSYQALSPAAARLFRMLAVHPGPDVTAHAAAALTGQPVDRVDPLLHELCSTNLIYEHVYGRYTWHDLLRAYATELVQAEKAQTRDEALRRLLGHYALAGHAASRLTMPSRTPIPAPAVPDGVTARELPDARRATAWFATEYRVVLALIRSAAANGLDEYMNCLAWSSESFFDDADLAREIVAVRRVVYESALRSGDLTVEARAARSLANAQSRLGYFDEARARLEAVLGRLGEAGDRNARGNLHSALAFLFHEQGDYRLALVHARQALAMARAEAHVWGQVICLGNLGLCYAKLGHGHQAVVAARASHRLQERLGPQEQSPLTWDVLGFGLQRLGRIDEAIAAYEHCMSAFPAYPGAKTLFPCSSASATRIC